MEREEEEDISSKGEEEERAFHNLVVSRRDEKGCCESIQGVAEREGEGGSDGSTSGGCDVHAEAPPSHVLPLPPLHPHTRCGGRRREV